ncbi:MULTISPECIES: GNAT family N-acetyltransferase [unclassified Devosia]|uniref:GNAT family N-acetyltransferase n=1 Tax=unclassified Devosia TaxID=196773 RepID=UPI000869F6D1|nr:MULTISPECIES: GNAT family N-acetyltransferase [unclassified Devosia]MBN9363132.1 GNAT family N-acetyltransferase [Devosia sp.]ODS87408.1 MAG: hypothetical protein ABS47_12265 [Devosia sp. SCN 66-27]OJX23374.1 MAG: hypothetical protein BGO83_00355 [Devosia sp. 66-14]
MDNNRKDPTLSDEAATKTSYSLFQEPWWLNLASGGNWDEVQVKGDDGIAARLPYYVRSRYGFKVLAQPHLTPCMGPWFRTLGAKDSSQYSDQYELAAELISKLPPFDVFRQNCCPEWGNWLPFHWAGFSQQTHYTYRINDLTDLDAVWSGFYSGTRRLIRKAQKELEVVVSDDVDKLCDLHELTYRQRGQAMPYRREALFRIVDGALRSGRARFVYAQDEKRNIHAINFLVYDERVAYYLVGGSDRQFGDSAAPTLLMWDAIQFAAQRSAIFDFEGSMDKGIEQFFRRRFNPQLTPLNRIYKQKGLFGLARHLRDGWIALSGGAPHQM